MFDVRRSKFDVEERRQKAKVKSEEKLHGGEIHREITSPQISIMQNHIN
jgi:hypothetical protein